MSADTERRHYIGEVLEMRPAVKRVSRRVAFRGYRVFIAAELDENGKVTQTAEVFKPARQYDPAVLSTNKYLPHQGERECIRRLRQMCRRFETPALDINL